MSTVITANRELQLAKDFVEYTGCNIFLTGRAGTGKTTFLHNLRKNTAKRLIVTAPTGVAAINAGGVTLHSFFQLPFGPFVPGSESHDRHKQRQFRFSREKRRIMKSLDLLVIDEISMVRADLLDAVDAELRRHRNSHLPFGGVQLLMIGDLHQLSPVARPEEWRLLGEHYESVYFFSSKALRQAEPVTIELQQIYRQTDARFIRLLNMVRDNTLDEAGRAELNQRCVPDVVLEGDEGYITLTTHNHGAESINNAKLTTLAGQEHPFRAEVSGDFPENSYPAPVSLRLKIGAQVMFIRNDPGADRRFYNGKIGAISRISPENIRVRCAGDAEEINVEAVIWQNIKYTVNSQTQEIEEEVIGEFRQLPLKLAWAITIHKSQGLTFDRAIVDAQAAFAHGQVYVALSRCRNLEGLVLSSPIMAPGMETDEAVKRFGRRASKNPPSEDRLQAEKIGYQQQLLLECFDFQQLRGRLFFLVGLLRGNAGVIQVSGGIDLDRLQQLTTKDILVVSENFRKQLRTIFAKGGLPEADPEVLERIAKASGWFQAKFAVIFEDLMRKLRVDTDNAELRKKINHAVNNLRHEIAVKAAVLKCCEKGFGPATYLRAVSAAEIGLAPGKVEKDRVPIYTESDVPHPELFRMLKDWRVHKAKEQQVGCHQILHQRVLIQVAIRLPDNPAALSSINGVGKKRLEKYGRELVAMVAAYRKKQGITKVTLPSGKEAPEQARPTNKKIRRGNTRDVSLEMFEQGMTIARIAGERGLVESTVESHLCFFVENGRLDIDRLLSAEKQRVIAEKLDTLQTNSLADVKNDLGDDYSYGQIRMVLAHRKFREVS